jgi:trehalose 6-phosphate synthase/phosphatase
MRERLRRFDVSRWGAEQVLALRAARAETAALAARRLTAGPRAALTEAWRAAARRLVLLDYDGTLVGFANDPASVPPDEALRALLRRLCALPGTQVVVVSGRDAPTLEAWLADLPVHLVAEHGARRRDAQGAWSGGPALPPELRERTLERMQVFADRLPGAWVEQKTCSLAWHWRPADPDAGLERASELAEALRALLRGTTLRVVLGQKVVEVRDGSADKGTAARAWLEAGPWDVVIASGDDATDEDLFAAMPPDAWTLRVGREASRARFNVDGPDDLRALLESLADAVPAAAPGPAERP